MQIATPHAVGVNGAKLRLVVVEDEHTLPDVSEGKVQFDRLADNRSIIATASETGYCLAQCAADSPVDLARSP
jgi:hypothetical protein